VAGTTERVSVASGGTQARGGDSTQASISDNGRYVAFVSQATNLVPGDTNHTYDIFVFDRKTRRTTRVSVASTGAQADGYSVWPSISADGRYVAFSSSAKNLAPDNDDFFEDVFVRDRFAGTTTMVSVSNEGESATFPALEPDISADGTAVAFHSESSNLVPNDTNGTHDVFVHDSTP
jgi:Tol biopolymer transport system component